MVKNYCFWICLIEYFRLKICIYLYLPSILDSNYPNRQSHHCSNKCLVLKTNLFRNSPNNFQLNLNFKPKLSINPIHVSNPISIHPHRYSITLISFYLFPLSHFNYLFVPHNNPLMNNIFYKFPFLFFTHLQIPLLFYHDYYKYKFLLRSFSHF